ncbi:hypothetical protein OO306_00035 [Pseudomonas sp. DCB_AW]|uniref:hypothetical protein n=1 Tax=Pseudomonas sp. DCB_AW TaxID=2993596 RepID=UPI002248AB44|nr:hypothetical protein [Pseudomonas sp. DCB_AW]MCX2683933.1 hypothetical protein [Pseudomonas sp. DCB_AW]
MNFKLNAWNPNIRLTRIVDANGNPVGRLLKQTGFDKETIHYLYDNGSNLPTRRVDGDRTTHFEYAPMGRLIQRKAG